MKKNFNDFTKDELLTYINDLRKQLNNEKFGLYFDRKIEPEDVVDELKTNIPSLTRNIEFDIDVNHSNNNLLIEGDNYHVLSCLNMINSSEGLIDTIYIDPPYNTGNKDWRYNNDFVDLDDGFKHTKWLNMMEKRLKLAHSLLKEDGIIIVSIDHYELFQLGMLMNEVFGEKNRLGIVSVIHKPEGRNQEKFFGTSNEFALFYAKNKKVANFQRVAISDEVIKSFNKTDEKGKYRDNDFMRKNRGTGGVDTSLRVNKPDFWYPIYVSKDLKKISSIEFKDANVVWPITKTGVEKAWRTLKSEFDIRNSEGLIYANEKDGMIQILEKYYENEVIKTHWIDKKYNAVMYGTNLLTKILGPGKFNFPKSVNLMKDIIKITTKKNGVILDFFAGSGTTGQAVLELNKEDGGNRRFILCTNNENNIMTDVCYPRIKTVITGIRPDGSRYSDGIPANIRYFKTTFIEDNQSSDQAKYNLVDKVDSLLCISENVFDRIDKDASYSIYRNASNGKVISIFNEYYDEKVFNKMLESLDKQKANKIIVYYFSLDNNIDKSIEELVLKEIPNAIVKPIPSKIYEIYKKISDDLKREY